MSVFQQDQRFLPLPISDIEQPRREGVTNQIKPIPSQGESAGPARTDPRGLLVECRLAVAAPSEIVWELLEDFAGWTRWNPLYSRTAGSLAQGETIALTLTVPGSRPVSFFARVTDVVANERVRYQAQVFGGLLRGTRLIAIEATGAESCILVNSEIMGGLLGPAIGRRVVDRIHLGLQLMSEGLQKVAEARWQGRSGPIAKFA
jgi:hypothetical protein